MGTHDHKTRSSYGRCFVLLSITFATSSDQVVLMPWVISTPPPTANMILKALPQALTISMLKQQDIQRNLSAQASRCYQDNHCILMQV